MAIINTQPNPERKALHAGTTLTAEGIGAVFGNAKDVNVIEARQVKGFMDGLRADPEHGKILTGGKAKKGELHPVVVVLIKQGYTEGSARAYLSKMRGIRTAYVNQGYIPKDGETWNGAAETAKKLNDAKRLSNAVHNARMEAGANLPKGSSAESMTAAMDEAEAAVRAAGGNRRTQTLDSYVASIVKTCDARGYDLAELIEKLAEIQGIAEIANVPAAAEVKEAQQRATTH